MKTEVRTKIFDYCKEAYYFQFDRREKINARVGVLLAIVAISANIALKYLDDLPRWKPTVPVTAFYLFLSVALVLALFSIYHVTKAIGKKLIYKYAPNPSPIVEFVREAEDRNKKLSDELQMDIGASFERNLIHQFADAATANDLANDAKNRHLLRAFQWTIATLMMLIACAVPFYYLRFNEPKSVQKVEVVNGPETKNHEFKR